MQRLQPPTENKENKVEQAATNTVKGLAAGITSGFFYTCFAQLNKLAEMKNGEDANTIKDEDDFIKEASKKSKLFFILPSRGLCPR